jgi:hypothetical protein
MTNRQAKTIEARIEQIKHELLTIGEMRPGSLTKQRRNAEFRQVCGFDPLLGEVAVPTDSAYSNFMESVLRHEEKIRGMFRRH